MTGVLRTPRRTISCPAEVPRAAAACLDLLVLSLGRSRELRPARVAEPQAAGGGQKKGDKTPGGGGAGSQGRPVATA